MHLETAIDRMNGVTDIRRAKRVLNIFRKQESRANRGRASPVRNVISPKTHARLRFAMLRTLRQRRHALSC